MAPTPPRPGMASPVPAGAVLVPTTISAGPPLGGKTLLGQ